MGTVVPFIVTSCTQRKSERPGLALTQLPNMASVEQLADAWRRLVEGAEALHPARDLYQGRSIIDTAATAALLASPWFVVSAGLGLVRFDQAVPAYECSAVANSALDSRLRLADANAADWWNAITSATPSPIARLVSSSPTLIALPGSYLRMVRDDLARVSAKDADRLRIFTSTAGARLVPSHLAMCVMPYDDRLESIRSFSGTRSDFAQRALRHFVEELNAMPMSLSEARDAVSDALAGLRLRTRPSGRRLSDEEIRRVLKAQWTRHRGSSARLLRHLRDEAGISCEQKRFSRIWQALRVELRP